MNKKLKVYTLRHHLWMYDSGTIWKTFKAEVKILLIIFAWMAVIAFYAASQTRR